MDRKWELISGNCIQVSRLINVPISEMTLSPSLSLFHGSGKDQSQERSPRDTLVELRAALIESAPLATALATRARKFRPRGIAECQRNATWG